MKEHVEKGYGRGMGSMLAMMYGPFGPSSRFFEDCMDQTGGMYPMDGVTLGILAGLAKPGDDPETIRKNIATAKEYAQEVERQWMQNSEDALSARHIKEAEYRVKEATERVAEIQAKLTRKEAALAEQDRIIAASGIDPKEPKTCRGKTLLSERDQLVADTEALKANITDLQLSLAEKVAVLAELTGKEAPKSPVEVPKNEPVQPAFKQG